jgi:hypothetical protein
MKISEIERTNEIINLLLSSINDWPKEVESLADFNNQLEKFIGDVSSLNNLKQMLKSMDFNKNAWESECIFQIIELFHYFEKCENLICIFDQLAGKLKF